MSYETPYWRQGQNTDIRNFHLFTVHYLPKDDGFATSTVIEAADASSARYKCAGLGTVTSVEQIN